MDTDNPHTDFARAYDMNSPELAHRWDEVVTDLHERCPVARSEVGEGYWVLNKHETVTKVAGDWESFSNADGFMPDRPQEMPYLYPQESDPPFHKTLRDALNPYFRPKVLGAHEDGIRAIAREMVADIRARSADGDVELIASFCNAFPGRVFGEAIAGMDADDITRIQATFDRAILGPVEGRGAAAQEAFEDVERYLRARQAGPRRDDVVQGILDLEFEGFDWKAKVGTFANLTLGGVGTTGFVFASALLHLARNPDARRWLTEDPARMRAAVEELIRFYAPSPHDGRRVMRDVEVDGSRFAKGEYVILSYGAASRDPAVFECPHEIVLDRKLPNRHTAFGSGIHRCIGNQLARIQLRVGLQEFLAEIPDFSVPEDFTPVYEISNTRVMQELRLVIGR